MGSKSRCSIRITGIVQGVGFRPFIYRLARRYQLSGWVRNDAHGVLIEAEGSADELAAFLSAVPREAPPQAKIAHINVREIPAQGDEHFTIVQSEKGEKEGGGTLVSPDLALCAECRREILNPSDRRYRYPFTNCTNCGPRFTIIQQMPYDRDATTMRNFTMCPVCRKEYDTPEDRRFHAQPNACPQCGPRLQLCRSDGSEVMTGDPLRLAVQALLRGEIVAIKGIGGMHLACSAVCEEAVSLLRRRKNRPDKPFALMVRDVEQARELCQINKVEEELLQSPAAPIVLLPLLPDAAVAPSVAPGLKRLGLMLPYTPLHELLLQECGVPLVMTSGNCSGLPMIHDNETALTQLRGVADWFLLHNRPIYVRCDDSVMAVSGGEPLPYRRARGYAPLPLHWREPLRETILACGAELKNTFCLGDDHRLYLSHYIGDLNNYETWHAYERAIDHYKQLFHLEVNVVAHDLHPDYLSTRFAKKWQEEKGLPAVAVQHHEAHVASCLGDNGCAPEERVIGIAFDGTGYGRDGAVWGGEFFVGSLREGFERRAHLAYVPLPGGDAAVKEPWRMALAYLLQQFDIEQILHFPLPFYQWVSKGQITAVADMIRRQLHCPLTSSAGRLFDAVAALAGIPGKAKISYEGQAAMIWEALAENEGEQGYSFRLDQKKDPWLICSDDVIAQVLHDWLAGVSVERIAARFHTGVARMVVNVCEQIRKREGISTVALSGGVWQNLLLSEQVVQGLQASHFQVFRHRTIPPNDGGLAVGQVLLAHYERKRHVAGEITPSKGKEPFSCV